MKAALSPQGEPQTPAEPEAGAPGSWELLAAEDLRALAWLHQVERSPEVLRAMFESGFPVTLSLVSPDQAESLAMVEALAAMEGDNGTSASNSADELAADFADIYLTYGMRASPFESIWRDEDHLMLQGPTFAVRDFYRRHGIHVSDWRQMSDDHLCHQLNFVALLLQRGERREAALFMKVHLMTWLPDFAERVAMRAATPFYAALAVLTQASCKACLSRLPIVAVMPPVVPAAAVNQCG
jgi:TorA maturation chaperone TorD